MKRRRIGLRVVRQGALRSAPQSGLRNAPRGARIGLKIVLFIVLYPFLLTATPVAAQDVAALQPIGSVTAFERTENAVTFRCHDNSQVQLTILAPDLVRVRAAFAKPIHERDHSWAIAKESWTTPRWTLSETPEAVTV
ncbi:MAG TPA: DUF4968 domain-containing protein, partial [Pyrinomonadaceae bacterium]|nr:DUF4968 domain-containing protein [Pyrinomonadaceae bacterium]